MLDFRPVGFVIGLLVTALGASMLLPVAADIAFADGHAGVFAKSALLTAFCGGMATLACANARHKPLGIQQTFLLTALVWLVLPVFGAIPFVIGAPGVRFVDAFFEAMSGMTTTGSTVFSGLDVMPAGTLLWRSMLQWFGGIGIVVVAMAFMPSLRVGGMQIFRSEGFDTMGKVLPRAVEMATQISVIYLGLTMAAGLAYALAGMTPWEALNHALTTVATGGFSTHDASFAAFKGAPEYVAVVFMLLAALPFARFVQLANGAARPLFADSQIRAFVGVALTIAALLATFRLYEGQAGAEIVVREALFNGISILTGTGYASTDYGLWGSFPVVIFFFIGLIGGCSGSTTCSIKVFRFQLLFSSIIAQIRRIHSPHGVFEPRFQGQRVSQDILLSVMAFFVLFIVSLAILSVLLSMTGLSTITAISGAATALANVGPGLGPEIGPAGNFAGLNDAAKWLLSAAMLLGRLELVVVFALFTTGFWRH